jgi:hypothetical protein
MSSASTRPTRIARIFITSALTLFAVWYGYGCLKTTLFNLWSYVFLNASPALDFQYSGARLFIHGKNPFLVYLSGDPHKEIILYQSPNYAQALYLLLAPLGMLKFDLARHIWSILNYLFALLSLGILSWRLHLNAMLTIAFSLLCLSQPAFGILLDNGQHGLLILVAVVLGVALMERTGSGASRTGRMLYGLTYLKYSFAPAFAAGLIRCKGTKWFLWSLIPAAAGVAVFVLAFGVNQESILGPVLCAQDSVNMTSPQMSDLMTMVQVIAPEIYSEHMMALALTFALLNFALPFLLPSRDPWEMASFCAVCSLSFIKHLTYDQVLLWIPLAWFLGNVNKTRLSWVGLGLLSWFWMTGEYASMLKPFFSVPAYEQVSIQIGFSINILLMCLLFWSAHRRHRSSSATSSPPPHGRSEPNRRALQTLASGTRQITRYSAPEGFRIDS